MFFPDPHFIATILIIKQQPSTVMTQCGSVMMISSCWTVCVSVKQFVCVSIKLFLIYPRFNVTQWAFLLLSFLSFNLSFMSVQMDVNHKPVNHKTVSKATRDSQPAAPPLEKKMSRL